MKSRLVERRSFPGQLQMAIYSEQGPKEAKKSFTNVFLWYDTRRGNTHGFHTRVFNFALCIISTRSQPLYDRRVVTLLLLRPPHFYQPWLEARQTLVLYCTMLNVLKCPAAALIAKNERPSRPYPLTTIAAAIVVNGYQGRDRPTLRLALHFFFSFDPPEGRRRSRSVTQVALYSTLDKNFQMASIGLLSSAVNSVRFSVCKQFTRHGLHTVFTQFLPSDEPTWYSVLGT